MSYLLMEKKKEMVELWTTVRIDPLMPLTGPHLIGSEKPCCPPVFPKVLGCLPVRGTPWGSFTVSLDNP